MKVIVTGGTGKQGQGALWCLLKQKDIAQIVVAARGVKGAEELIAALGDKRLVAKFIDLANIDGAAKVLQGADVVVNCAYDGKITDDNYVNLDLMATKAALEAGVNYTNVSGSPVTPGHLALHNQFERKKILAILGMGSLTGFMQVMAAYAINKLNSTHSVDIRYGERDLVPPEEHSRPIAWGVRKEGTRKTDAAYVGLGSTRFRYGAASVSYEDGTLRHDPPRGNPEVFEFREPIGALTVAQVTGAAVTSLSRSFPEVRHISSKTGGDPDFEAKIGFLRDLGFFGKEPINVQGHMILPWEVLMPLLEQLPPETNPADIRSEARVIVKGSEAGNEVEYTLSWLRVNPNALKEHIVPASGLCAAIAAMMIGRGQIKAKGVLMPEVCIPPDQYLDEFVNVGMEIEITKKVMLGYPK